MLRNSLRHTPVNRIVLAAAVVFIAACGTQPPKPTEDVTDITAPEAAALADALLVQAQAAEDLGNLAVAARLYQELAQVSTSPLREDYRLNAAAALTRGGYLDNAEQLLRQLAQQPQTPQQTLQSRIITARIALQRQNPEQALALLRLPATHPPAPAQSITLARLRAEAYTQQGDALEAARERVWLDELLTEPDEAHNNRLQLWLMLSALETDALQAFITQPPPDTLSGWLELAYRVKSTTSQPQQLDSQLQAWRQRYPSHNGDLFFNTLLADDSTGIGRPQSIALLLPLSGNFAAPASAVRDGFLAGYFANQTETTAEPQVQPNTFSATLGSSQNDPWVQAPRVRIYDTTGDVEQGLNAYRQAIADGAELVVGPLHKQVVEALVQTQEIPVATLALNYSQSKNNGNNLFQFGLLPEDEARQVAERTWLDGHNRALVLTPSGEWGERMAQSFTDHWQMMGGAVAEWQTYDPSRFDFSGPLEQLLNIDRSEQRKRQLQALVGKELKYEPRRRGDVDFIFAAAFPQQARQIRPQLKFHYAGDLPIYSTSHAYSGQLNDTADRDMDDITFCDMPWVLASSTDRQPNWQQINELWPTTAGAYQRLYAMGVDAYLLIPWLKYLQLHPEEHLRGETGNLFLDVENRVHRQLMWARLNKGRPQLLETGN